MEFPNLTTSLIFAAICLTTSVGVVHLSGFVPTDGPTKSPSKAGMKSMFFGGMLLTACLVVVGLGLVFTQIGWAFGIVIAGSAFLIAPFLVEPLPAHLKDGALGLAVFIALAAVTLGLGITETWGG